MNITFRHGHVNDLANIKVKDHALAEALNYVQHWRRDRDVNLAPTLESLNHVESVLRNAIASGH